MKSGVELIADGCARRIVRAGFCSRCPKSTYIRCGWVDGEPKCRISNWKDLTKDVYRVALAEIDRLNNLKQNNK